MGGVGGPTSAAPGGRENVELAGRASEYGLGPRGQGPPYAVARRCPDPYYRRMGETRVDLLHLLEDLRDAYPGSLEETILTEIVANALDSGSRRVVVATDRVARTFTVSDDGAGMVRRSLRSYHDLASTSKRRGRSIGFAGVGIKLALLIADEVVTETRRGQSSLATSWRLTTRKRAPWRWIEPPGLRQGTGTTVRIYLTNALSDLLEPPFVEATLLRHFEPLFRPDFDEMLREVYPVGVRFVVNGRELPRYAPHAARVPVRVRIGRQRKPTGAGYLVFHEDPGDEDRGIAISTLGKVIKRGWDWLGLAPLESERVSGLIEVPPLVEALTLNKADFIRTGRKGGPFIAYRKALQKAVTAQLEAWGGDAPRPAERRPARARALERDLRSVLANLSEVYPILATLVESRKGGQHRLPLGEDGRGGAMASAVDLPGEDGEALVAPESSGGQPAPEPGERAVEPPEEEGGESLDALVTPQARRTRRRPGHLGLRVEFEARPDDERLGALVESTLRVNTAHPAYRRASASRSEGYHIALTVALTLAPLAVEATEVESFVTDFLTAWGEAGTRATDHG